jgi:Tfp pilus assembly protein PilO
MSASIEMIFATIIQIHGHLGWKKSCLVICAVMCSLYFVTVPMLESIFTNVHIVFTGKKQIAQAGNFEFRNKNMHLQLKTLESNLAAMDGYLNRITSSASLLTMVQQAALQTDVRLQVVEPRLEDKQLLKVRLEATGNYKNLARFINRMEKNAGQIRIEEFTLTPQPKTGLLVSDVLLSYLLNVDNQGEAIAKKR